MWRVYACRRGFEARVGEFDRHDAGGPAWAKVLLPPAEVGGHRFAVEGCAAQAGGGEPVTRSAPTGSAEETGDKVAVSGLSGGFVLSHALDHTCCLKADSKVEVSGQKVTITEQFSGNACRCRCRSTLKTAVGLGQGTFEVEVKVSDAGGTRSAYTGQVVVK